MGAPSLLRLEQKNLPELFNCRSEKITRAGIWHAASDGHVTMGREDLLCSRLDDLASSVVAATPRKERGGAQ
jgi:hypothetical protein